MYVPGGFSMVIGEWSPTLTLSIDTVASAGTTVSCRLPGRFIDHQYQKPLPPMISTAAAVSAA